MKCKLITFYTSRYATNDTYVVTLEQNDGEPIPIDQMQFERQGNKVQVAGRWKDEKAADAHAKAIFEREHHNIEWI